MTTFLSLAEAIADQVHDGDIVALEGFTHLIPFAAGHEIIRQRRRDLTLVRMTPDLIYDQMIGMGCARKLIFSWGGNPGVGSLHRFRDAVEQGWPASLEIEEHSHAASASSSAPSPASGSRRFRRCVRTWGSSTRNAPTGPAMS
jgi:glutaconate CoA-transferase subunit A